MTGSRKTSSASSGLISELLGQEAVGQEKGHDEGGIDPADADQPEVFFEHVPQGQGIGVLDAGGLNGGLVFHAAKIFFFPLKVNMDGCSCFFKILQCFLHISCQGGELVQENTLL